MFSCALLFVSLSSCSLIHKMPFDGKNSMEYELIFGTYVFVCYNQAHCPIEMKHCKNYIEQQPKCIKLPLL